MTPWAVAHQASQSMGIFWQEYWSEKKKKNTGVGCHILLQGTLPTQESNLHLLHWQADSLSWSHMESPFDSFHCNKMDICSRVTFAQLQGAALRWESMQ